MRRASVLAAILAAGCGGKKDAGGKLDITGTHKLRLGMTEAEVRDLLGPGKEATAERELQVRTSPGFAPTADRLTFRTWGDAMTWTTVAYRDGKVYHYNTTTLDPGVDLRDPKQVELTRKVDEERVRGARRKRAEAAAARASDKREDWERSFIAEELRDLAGRLESFAFHHDKRLPKDLAELDAEPGEYPVLDLLRTGDYSVAWGGPRQDRTKQLVAYERAAAESAGLVIRADGTIEKLTKDQLAEELAAIGR